MDQRLTPQDVRDLKKAMKDGKWYVLVYRPQIERAIAEIERLGGPVCVACLENKARYTTDRCALCDSALPEGERGDRIG